MAFLGDPRRRSIALFGLGVALLIALLGTLQAFNIRILNPETPGETIVFTGLIVLVFLLLMVLLMLLLRNILKLYADQSSSALGARLRTRMVLGATLIALTPAVFMFLFSFLLMNRSIDRWFSQPTTELREDSTRVSSSWRNTLPAMPAEKPIRLLQRVLPTVTRKYCRQFFPPIVSRSMADSLSSLIATGTWSQALRFRLLPQMPP